MFRTTYDSPSQVHARWLLAYLTWRGAICPRDLIVQTATSVIRDVRSAIPQPVAALDTFVVSTELPDTVTAKHAVVYVSKILSDQGILPIIVTAVSQEKMVERIHEAMVDMKVEGYTTVMSDRRVLTKAACVPVSTGSACLLLAALDARFKDIVPNVGMPPAFEEWNAERRKGKPR
jgi:hypothetical protein